MSSGSHSKRRRNPCRLNASEKQEMMRLMGGGHNVSGTHKSISRTDIGMDSVIGVRHGEVFFVLFCFF
jgi:hypothetical protein